MAPPGNSRGRLPLHLDIHGGPHGAWPSTVLSPEHQSLAAAGYLVLLPNPRGSCGYGQEFTAHAHMTGAVRIARTFWPVVMTLSNGACRLQPDVRGRLLLRRVHDELDRGPYQPFPRKRRRALPSSTCGAWR